jgi:hypothetical protein
MRKSWPFVIVVIVVGGLAGLAIAGRPEPSDPFVLDPSVTVARSTTPDRAPTTSVPATTSATTTTVSASTTVATTVPPTTVPPTTVPPTTTATPPTTIPAPTTTLLGPLPRNQVRLVLANGDGRFRLASTTADRIRPLGYNMILGDALSPVDATIIYYRPGFDDEAAYAADDIGVPDAIIVAFPNNAPPITDSDASGDVIVVLGPDAPR